MFENATSLLRTLVILALLALVGWWTLMLRGALNEHEAELEESREQIVELEGEVRARDVRIEELGDEIHELETAMRLLKVDHRLARIEVVELGSRGDATRPTRLRFTELDGEGRSVGAPRDLEVLGTRVYLESLVIKFEDDYVEGGDFLRGSSICLFRRAFGELQAPEDGALIESGRMPRIYAGDEDPDPFYDQLWERFWDYAIDPDEAAEAGVRALHGEAPFMELRDGASYLVELRSSGGLTLRAE